MSGIGRDKVNANALLHWQIGCPWMHRAQQAWRRPCQASSANLAACPFCFCTYRASTRWITTFKFSAVL